MKYNKPEIEFLSVISDENLTLTDESGFEDTTGEIVEGPAGELPLI